MFHSIHVVTIVITTSLLHMIFNVADQQRFPLLQQSPIDVHLVSDHSVSALKARAILAEKFVLQSLRQWHREQLLCRVH